MQRGNLKQIRPGVWRYRLPSHKTQPAPGRTTPRRSAPPARPTPPRRATRLARQWDEADARRPDPTHRRRARRRLGHLPGRAWSIGHHRVPQPVDPRRYPPRPRPDPLADLTAEHLDRWYVDLMACTPAAKGARPITANTALHYHRVMKAIPHQGYKWGGCRRTSLTAPAHPDTHVDVSPRMPTPDALALVAAKASLSARMAILLTAATGPAARSSLSAGPTSNRSPCGSTGRTGRRGSCTSPPASPRSPGRPGPQGAEGSSGPDGCRSLTG